ncbi:MAG: DegT/DnrJ/EryC1/StrS family aminotransferase [Pseudomonadota bacterium]
MTVPFYRHGLDDTHAQAAAEVIRTPHLTYGNVAKRVEARIGTVFGGAQCALTSSWSTAAFATFKALGIGPGDEVIVPAMTFVATANIPLLCGARVRLVDAEPDTLLLDAAQVEEAINPRTKAIFCVHLYGQMCDMLALRQLADRHGLYLIEDCAHAFESAREDVQPAALSDAALFSFYATKNLTCGEGGAVVTRHGALFEKISRFRAHGMSASASDRFKNQYYQHWDVEEPGMKGSLPDILAALLEPQIDTCLDRLELRAQRAQHYRKALENLPIRLPVVAANARHAEHLFPIWVAPQIRDKVIAHINTLGIGCTVNYRALTQLSLFAADAFQAPVAEEWGSGTLSLPLYPDLPFSAIDDVVDALKSALACCENAAA